MIKNMTLRVPSLSEAVVAYHALGYERTPARPVLQPLRCLTQRWRAYLITAL